MPVWRLVVAAAIVCGTGSVGAAERRPQLSQQRVAVCLRGGLRGGPEVLESIEERVLRPLGADVFVYVALQRHAPTEGQAQGELKSPMPQELARLAALPGLMSLHLEAEDPTALLEAEVRRRHQAGGPSVGAILERTRAVAGSWLGGISEGAPRGKPGETRVRIGKGLVIMLAWHRCLEMVKGAEEMAGGRPYDWVVDTRLDMFWERPHVPLGMLAQDAIWISEGSDFGGLNDRHAVIPRGAKLDAQAGRLSASEMYLGAWRFVAEGKAAVLMHELLAQSGLPVEDSGCDPAIDGPVKQPCANSEGWLAMRLRAQEIRVKRLPGLSWVVCPAEIDARTNLLCVGNGSRSRYQEEFDAARVQAECLREHLGMTWGSRTESALGAGRAAIKKCWCPAEVRQGGSFDSGFPEQDFFALCV